MQTFKHPICEGSEWTINDLQTYADAFEEINNDKYKLDIYNNQIEVITSKKMIDAYSSHAMPVYFPYWANGKAANQIADAYRKGEMGLAYEVVINSDPCIAYLMEENSAMMQALVISHANYGHNAFFKNNYLFKQTQASNIIDYLTMARQYILACEEKYGPEEVEVLLDACHALERHAISYRNSAIKLTKEQQEAERAHKLKFLQASLHDLDSVTTLTKEEQAAKMNKDIDGNEKDTRFPARNILKFIGENSMHLKPWQRTIIDMFCYISDYFRPQMQTQLMNEGFATHTHYEMMHDLYDRGGLSNGQMMEFYASHTAVTEQPEYHQPWYGGINVYAIGFHMMQKIKQVCVEPTEKDKKQFSFAGDAENHMEVIKEIVANYRDESFIQDFLTTDTTEKFKMFAVRRDSDLDFLTVVGTANPEELSVVKDAFAQTRDPSNNIPNLTIESYDPTGDRTLTITHRAKDFRRVYMSATTECLTYAKFLWGDNLIFEEYDQSFSNNLGKETVPVNMRAYVD